MFRRLHRGISKTLLRRSVPERCESFVSTSFSRLYLKSQVTTPDLPDRLFNASPVQPLSQKYSCSLPTQITFISAAIPSRTEGRIAIVTDVGHGMRWTRQRRARNRCRRAAPLGVRERCTGARTNGAFSAFAKTSAGLARRPSKLLARTGRGRRSRVVLTPRRWRQVLRRCNPPNRVVMHHIR